MDIGAAAPADIPPPVAPLLDRDRCGAGASRSHARAGTGDAIESDDPTAREQARRPDLLVGQQRGRATRPRVHVFTRGQDSGPIRWRRPTVPRGVDRPHRSRRARAAHRRRRATANRRSSTRRADGCSSRRSATGSRCATARDSPSPPDWRDRAARPRNFPVITRKTSHARAGPATGRAPIAR